VWLGHLCTGMTYRCECSTYNRHCWPWCSHCSCVTEYCEWELYAQCAVVCSHLFHKLCIDPWLIEQRSCPICKLDILQAYGLHVSIWLCLFCWSSTHQHILRWHRIDRSVLLHCKNGWTDPVAVWKADLCGPKEPCIVLRCTVAPPGEYDWMICAPWWCGLSSGYFDRLL